MPKQSSARRLDVKSFAEEAGALTGQEPVGEHPRLLAETQGRGAETPVAWSAAAEIRNPLHHTPQVWLKLKAGTTLSLTCQRCLGPVDVPVSVDRLFRFVADEETAAAEDDESEEDVLALSRSFDVLALVEDELLMEMPLAPRHETCPPVHVVVEDEGFEGSSARHENPFAVLGQLKAPKQGE
ncbi:MAG TPA: DUF177 domain-containing protein [Ramlibacter sp.]|nr:DUF177 domain-containing protein [Ramlibacter sp.]